MAWEVDEREDPAIAADLVSRACLRERISKGRKQPLILHADNGNAMRATTLESRLEQGRLKVCPRRPWRACQPWLWSAGLTAPNVRNRFHRNRSGYPG